MPRVDLDCRYTRLPAKPSAGFPDRVEVWRPFVRLGLKVGQKQIRTLALLDTGADFNYFGTKWADALGIDWKAAPQVPFSGVGTAENMGYAADVNLILLDDPYSWPARIVFSPAMDTFGIPLLGHLGFFEHFEVRLKTGARKFHVHLK